MNESTNCHPYTFAGLKQSRIEKLTEIEIIKMVADIFLINTNDITGKYRGKTVVCARHYTCYIFHKILKRTTTYTGGLVGCDHASVLFACKRVANDFAYISLTGRVPELLEPYWVALKKIVNYGTNVKSNTTQSAQS
jgi:hypothetical protein